MSHTVNLPTWLVILGGGLGALALLKLLVLPLFRLFFRRRKTRTIDEINERLDLRLPEFKLLKRQNLINRLVYDTRILQAVKQHCLETGISEEKAIQKVERYAREIVPAFDAYLYFRFGSWLGRVFSRLLYRVRVGFADEEGFQRVNPDSSVVFVMNHRSNMDYILLAYLAIKRVAMSFAVGEWARVWPVKHLVRALGAYFVRRSSGNTLYRQVLARYVHMATEAGVVQAVFLEGRLSRDGGLGDPKIGLLDYMLRSFHPDEGRDLVFIPVGVNYDRVLEDRSLLITTEPKAEPKSKWGVIKTTSFFFLRNFWLMFRGGWYRYGYAVVNFGTPLSIREYAQEYNIDFRKLDKEERIDKVKHLAQILMQAVGQVVPVVPLSLVSTVFSENPGKALTETEIKVCVQRLLSELEKKGSRVYIPRRDHDYTIEVGLRLLILRHIVQEHHGSFRAEPGESKILHYYANSIAHLRQRPSK